MNSDEIEQKLFLTDGRKNLICVPYSVENLHSMAMELGIPTRFFDRDKYKIPDTIRDDVEDKCELVSSQTIFRTIHKVMG
jgi:hypothetical protein